jgi:hypothetical protein
MLLNIYKGTFYPKKLVNFWLTFARFWLTKSKPYETRTNHYQPFQ